MTPEEKKKRMLDEVAHKYRNHDVPVFPMDLSILEFIEFTSAEEFRKFAAMPIITDEDIAAVDWTELCRLLLEDEK